MDRNGAGKPVPDAAVDPGDEEAMLSGFVIRVGAVCSVSESFGDSPAAGDPGE